MGLISWIIIGFVVGVIGYAVAGRRHDNRPIIAGIIGGVVGGIIAAIFGAAVIGFSLAGAIVSLIFAIAALWVLRLVTR